MGCVMQSGSWVSFLGGAMVIAMPTTLRAESVVIDNGAQFRTVSGKQINAHGGGVIKVGAFYYLLGENRNPDNSFRAVSMYRSADLKHWEFRNDVLRSSSASELNRANVERPKIIYNAVTRTFVLWAHKENGRDYREARVAVATSSTIDGDYKYMGSFRPMDNQSRDMTLFQDTDGAAYLISAAAGNYDLNIYRLSADFTKIDSLVTVLHGYHREAPAIVKRAGTYFLLTSGASGWTPNMAAYFTATSLAGPWSKPTWFGHPYTFNSQSTFILPVQGSAETSYLYMGDRWGPASGQAVNDSTYVWLPMTFPTDTTMAMPTASQITIDVARGTITPGSATTPLARMRSAHTAFCLNIADPSDSYRGVAEQGRCTSAANGVVERRAVGKHVQFVLQHSGLCLAQAAAKVEGSHVIQTSCSIGPRAQWTYDGTTIVNRASGSCLDAPRVPLDMDAQVRASACTGHASQAWSFVQP